MALLDLINMNAFYFLKKKKLMVNLFRFLLSICEFLAYHVHLGFGSRRVWISFDRTVKKHTSIKNVRCKLSIFVFDAGQFELFDIPRTPARQTHEKIQTHPQTING